MGGVDKKENTETTSIYSIQVKKHIKQNVDTILLKNSMVGL